MQDCLIREAYCKNRVGDVGHQSRSQGLQHISLQKEASTWWGSVTHDPIAVSRPLYRPYLLPLPSVYLCLAQQLPNATPPLILLIHHINLGRLVMTSLLLREGEERVVMLLKTTSTIIKSMFYNIALKKMNIVETHSRIFSSIAVWFSCNCVDIKCRQ